MNVGRFSREKPQPAPPTSLHAPQAERAPPPPAAPLDRSWFLDDRVVTPRQWNRLADWNVLSFLDPTDSDGRRRREVLFGIVSDTVDALSAPVLGHLSRDARLKIVRDALAPEAKAMCWDLNAHIRRGMGNVATALHSDDFDAVLESMVVEVALYCYSESFTQKAAA